MGEGNVPMSIYAFSWRHGLAFPQMFRLNPRLLTYLRFGAGQSNAFGVQPFGPHQLICFDSLANGGRMGRLKPLRPGWARSSQYGSEAVSRTDYCRRSRRQHGSEFPGPRRKTRAFA